MEFKELDRLFDETMGRLGQPEAGKPEAESFSANQELLKKSWGYFKERIKTIEDHWSEILRAKQQQIASLEEELSHARSTGDELDRENKSFKLFENTVKETRKEDLTNFKKLTEKLKMAFEEEHVALESQRLHLENKVKEDDQVIKHLKEDLDHREKKHKEKLDEMLKEKYELTQNILEKQKEFQRIIDQSEEEIQSRERKVDLMRGEMDRRDMLLKKAEERLRELEDHQVTLSREIKQANVKNSDLIREIHHLKEKIDFLESEKKSTKTNWDREQAEWRELWDRARETWEKQKEELKMLREKTRQKDLS